MHKRLLCLSIQIVKQLWAYIRKHNLQDPGNKRKIICDDALRLVFETDCTDMFKMNKLLAKHILPLDPMSKLDEHEHEANVLYIIFSANNFSNSLLGLLAEQSVQAKKLKVEDESAKQSPPDPSLLPVIISDALAKFFGTGEREMLQSEALGRVWEYIKVNQLEVSGL